MFHAVMNESVDFLCNIAYVIKMKTKDMLKRKNIESVKKLGTMQI